MDEGAALVACKTKQINRPERSYLNRGDHLDYG